MKIQYKDKTYSLYFSYQTPMREHIGNDTSIYLQAGTPVVVTLDDGTEANATLASSSIIHGKAYRKTAIKNRTSYAHLDLGEEVIAIGMSRNARGDNFVRAQGRYHALTNLIKNLPEDLRNPEFVGLLLGTISKK